MRRYAWAEILILLHILLKNTEKKKAPKDTLDAELDEIRQLEEVGFLPKGSAEKAYRESFDG
jgi:hypothetical protein